MTSWRVELHLISVLSNSSLELFARFSFAANSGLFKMLEFHANRSGCLGLSRLFSRRQLSRFWRKGTRILYVGLVFWSNLTAKSQNSLRGIILYTFHIVISIRKFELLDCGFVFIFSSCKYSIFMRKLNI